MALLSDVYGDNFAKEMQNKKYEDLEDKKPLKPILTPEEIEENKKRSDKLRDEIILAFKNKIVIGEFNINTLCHESFPCQHYCNGQLMYSTQIYKLLLNSNIDMNNLSVEQKNFIKHITQYDLIKE